MPLPSVLAFVSDQSTPSLRVVTRLVVPSALNVPVTFSFRVLAPF
jgi:hypothetical protein